MKHLKYTLHRLVYAVRVSPVLTEQTCAVVNKKDLWLGFIRFSLVLNGIP
jgi:hypothetical protein